MAGEEDIDGQQTGRIYSGDNGPSEELVPGNDKGWLSRR